MNENLFYTNLERSRIPAAPLWRALLDRKLRKIRSGHLTVTYPSGETAAYGDPASPERASVRIHTNKLFTNIALGGELALGEAFMDGMFDSADPAGLLRIFIRNRDVLSLSNTASRWLRYPTRIAHLLSSNSKAGSRRNIHYHYDLGNDFYRLFLDESLAYSCAYYKNDSDTLEAAQINKFQLICAKLGLAPGTSVLEIGSGWGGFAIHAATTTGCRVTSITVSRQQYEFARRRVAGLGLEDLIDIQYCDYRDVKGSFDRIVSIEMFEAVGFEYYSTFFGVCDRVLKPGGSMLLQTIARGDQDFDKYLRRVDWMQKYIFPGTCIPSIGAISTALGRAGELVIRHVEDIGPHYAPTLRAWRKRFYERIDDVKKLGFGQRFIRMWELYLCFSEAGFEERYLMDLQFIIERRGDRRIQFQQ